MISQERTCIVCGKTGGHCFPRCAECEMQLLEWWVSPEAEAPFSEASKDMMRKEIKELKAYLEEKRDE